MAHNIDYVETHREEWFEIQVSRAGTHDWNATGEQADTLAGILDKLSKQDPRGQNAFEYRAVLKTLTERVVTLTQIPPAAPQKGGPIENKSVV